MLCFLTLAEHCLKMLCLPGFGTHANTQNLPRFRASLLVSRSTLPRNGLFFMANAKLPNRPGFALPHGPNEPSPKPLWISKAQRSIQRMGFKLASCLNFETLAFWYPFVLVPVCFLQVEMTLLRIVGNGGGKKGYGNRPLSTIRNPMRKLSIDPLSFLGLRE